MPAKSKSQQQFFGLVRKCQKTGECSSPTVKKAADSMKNKDVDDFAGTKHKDLPKKISESFRDYLLNEEQLDDGFKAYMVQVDKILENKIGFGHNDLPDYNWIDAYEDQISPEDAANDFMENEFEDYR